LFESFYKSPAKSGLKFLKNSSAQLALSIYSRRIAHYINAYIGFLGGVDAIIFTGGIGENAYYIRQQVANYLKHLNITLSPTSNLQNKLFINAPGSLTKVMILSANEELEIAQQSLSLVQKKT
jgi:acetate kinase